MLQLSLQTLRGRKGGALGTFIALLLGAAVLSACGALLESGLRSGSPTERFTASDALVAGRQRVDFVIDTGEQTRVEKEVLVERVPVPATAVDRVTQVPGVSAVIPDVSVPVQVVPSSNQPVPGRHAAPVTAHSWSTTRLGSFRLAEGQAPRGDRDVVLDVELAKRAGLRPDDTVDVMTAGSSPRPFRISGTVALEGGALPSRSVVYFSDDHLHRLAAGKEPDVLGVLASPGVSASQLSDAISEALQDKSLSVHTGDGRGKVEFLDTATAKFDLILLAVSVSTNVLLIAVFIVFSTMVLSIQHRRREVALLRAVGATPKQIRQMLRTEALIVSLTGGVLGWPIGIWLTRWMSSQLSKYGVVPPDFEPFIGPLPGAGALLIVVLTALIASYSASRRATRIRPTEALGEASAESPQLSRWRKITGAVMGVGSVGMLIAGITNGGDFTTLVGLANGLVLTLAITAGVLGPGLAKASMRVLEPILRCLQVTGQLATSNAKANLLRTAGAVTPLILAVSFASTVVFAQTTALKASADQLRGGLTATHVLTSPGGISPDVAERVAGLEQVAAASGLAKTKVVAITAGDEGAESPVSLTAQGLDPEAVTKTVDLQVTEGSFSELTPRTVAISEMASSWLGVELGETISLHLGDGTPVEPRVVAVYERGLAFADFTFDHDMLITHTTSQTDESVLVRAEAGAQDIDDRLAEVAGAYPGMVVSDRLALDAQVEELRADAWVNYLVVGMLIVYTAITVVNSQVMNTMARRREFALLRLSGTSSRQVRRMMWWESLAVVVSGLVIGTVASIPPLMLVSMALSGSPWPSVPVMTYAVITGVLGALAVLGAMFPTRVLLMSRPVDSI
jgi:putative ABC transport system permease protein